MAGKGSENGNGNGERLTPLQSRFVDHWFECRYNGTEAARRAGYSGDDATLASQASRVLRYDKVKAEIAKRFGGHGGTAEEVIAGLLDIARHSDPSLFFEGGQILPDKLKEHGRYLHTVYKTQHGWRISCYSRLDALKELAHILKAGGLEEKGEAWSGDVNVFFRGELVE